MLSSIKNKIKGWVAYLIIGLITIPFALFGIGQYFTGTSNVTIAVVDGVKVSQQEFLSKFNPQKRRLQQTLAEKYNDEFELSLKKSVMNQIIQAQLLDKLVIDLEYAATAEELQAVIQTNNLFKTEGQFSLEKYKQLLRLNGYSVLQYETNSKTQLIQNQIKSNLNHSAFVTPYQLSQLQMLNNQQRQFNYLVLDAKDYKNQVKASPEKIQAFYNGKKAAFFTPEQVKIDFIELSLSGIAKDIQVNDEALLGFYEEDKERYSSEEERKAQHILLDDKAQANQVLDLLNKGGDFAQLAAEYSQDTGSKDDAGSLGFFTRGVMVPAFEEKAFSMNVGELSDLVKSEFGYHIIKLNEIKPSAIKAFDTVKVELLDSYREIEAQKLLYTATEQMANLAYEVSLEVVATQMDLTLQSSDFFTKNDTKLDRKIVNAAFDDAVLNQGENSPVLELAKNTFAVIRLQERQAQKQKTFAEVKAEIGTLLNQQLAKKKVADIAKKITDFLAKDNHKAAEQLMQKNKLEWHKVGWVGRDSKKAELQIINKLFTLKKPKALATTYSTQDLDDNRAVVMALSKVRTTKSDISDVAIKQSLLSIEENEVFANIVETLKRNADIEIYTQRF